MQKAMHLQAIEEWGGLLSRPERGPGPSGPGWACVQVRLAQERAVVRAFPSSSYFVLAGPAAQGPGARCDRADSASAQAADPGVLGVQLEVPDAAD